MEIPPTYAEAVSKDPLPTVAAYLGVRRILSRTDLRAASLVSRRWCDAFQAELWEVPSARFGSDEGDRYHALITFLQCLRTARLTPRSCTRIVNLSRVSSQIMDGYPPSWLLDLLEYLPNLQSITVDGVPFMDYPVSRLLCLAEPAQGFNLRLLNVSGCTNIMARSLPKAFKQFPLLEYLDMSSTSKARGNLDPEVCHPFSFPHLQVLKLRDIGLSDSDLLSLDINIAGVWSLDVRDNKLTNACVDRLIAKCFSPPGYDDGSASHQTAANLQRDRFKRNNSNGDEENHFVARLKYYSPLNQYDNHFDRHLTHLYISGNNLTSRGLVKLLDCGSLLALDCGNIVDGATNDGFDQAEYARILGAAQLVESIKDGGGRNLTWLRANHRFVTGAASLMDLHAAVWGRYREHAGGRPFLQPSATPSPPEIAAQVASLETLILTGIPQECGSGEVAMALQGFLRGLAESSHDDEVNGYGADHKHRSSRQHARLRNLQLEISMHTPTRQPSFCRQYRSVTQDEDSENFVKASAKDFSFFPEEKAGTPSSASSSPPQWTSAWGVAAKSRGTASGRPMSLPVSPLKGLTLSRAPSDDDKSRYRASSVGHPLKTDYGRVDTHVFDDDTQEKVQALFDTGLKAPQVFEPEPDVVASLIKYRRETKAAFDAASSGSAENDDAGKRHWSGVIRVVRQR